MSKTFYSDYVRHALRFYTRNCDVQPIFKTEVDKSNWLSCQSVLKKYSNRDQDILIYVYSGHDTLPDEVYNASKNFDINQNIIWDMMKDVEHKIAIRRKLI